MSGRRGHLRRQWSPLVNTINRKGKTHRTRTGIGKSKDTRRAIVTLREGTIDILR